VFGEKMMRIILATIAFIILASSSWGSEYNFIKEQRLHGEDYVPDWDSITYTEPNEYKTYEGIPCNFHGAEVGGNNNSATLGDLRKKCCPSCKGYKGKIGQSIHAKRGTPVYAIADMTLKKIRNYSSIQKCSGSGNFSCEKPFDNLRIIFEDSLGNEITYYHLMSENPLVKGFGKGKCSLPNEYNTELYKSYPSHCGGFDGSSHIIKVRKGGVIGFVGTTGSGKWDNHFSIGIFIWYDPRFNGEAGMVVPANNFEWENYPTDDPMKYLLPIAPR